MAYSGGSGILADPYQIASLSDINQLKADVVAGITYKVYYKQTADIELGTFEPIGYKNTSPYYYYFNGYYDGDYKILKNGTISYPGEDYIGIFAYAEGGESGSGKIEKVIVENVSVVGNSNVGAICGTLGSFMENCKVDSNSSVVGVDNTGGLIGYQDYYTIINCNNFASVTGNNNVGGIVGIINLGATSGVLLNCYNEGEIIGASIVGGIVGKLQGQYITYEANVFYCINTGNISGIDSVGGIAGYTTDEYCGIFNCFALNDSITRLSGINEEFGRIIGYAFLSGSSYLNNNYVIDTMQFISIS